MFTIHPPRSRTEADLPVPAQFRLVKTALVGQNLIGEWGGDLDCGYNPFELYGAAESSRGQALAPHLVFASLDSTVVDDACAFLDAYGPLDGPEYGPGPTVEDMGEWKKASRKSTPPEEHFRAILGQVPLLPGPPIPQGVFHCYPKEQFWKAQLQFERTLRLSSALNSPGDPAANIRRALAKTGDKWDIKGPSAERQYIRRAQELVLRSLNSNLNKMQPRATKDLGGGSRISGAWPCYTLLEAMYLMLFLDIASRGVRVAQCEKCARLFYADREKGKYCSPVCENRARALRAYYRRR